MHLAGNSGSKGDEKTQIRARLGVLNRMNGLGGPAGKAFLGWRWGVRLLGRELGGWKTLSSAQIQGSRAGLAVLRMTFYNCPVFPGPSQRVGETQGFFETFFARGSV